jgi:Tol biopolymer transport system component
MAWPAVFSPDGRHVAARVELDGKQALAVNDRLWHHDCELAFAPSFSPDGRRLLIRSLENGVFHRRVVSVEDIAG